MSRGAPSPDEIWDRWGERTDPDQEPEAFARAFPGFESEVRRTLELMLRLERPGPLPSLVPEGPEGWWEEGLLFAGFRLVRLLGQGSFGRVFEAVDERGEPLALKILNPLIASVAAGHDVIRREAQIAAQLDHPCIVRLIDAGEHRGYAWIATELFEGVPLSELPLSEGSADERREAALEIGAQVAQALDHSHASGIVHRDLKPANVLLDGEGRVKVLDFGLARARGTVFGVSATGQAVGTPLYMAPEQARGERVGPEADLYSLGLILLELASGERLERRVDGLRGLLQLARGRTVVPRQMWKGLDPGLAAVLRRCLEPDPRDRCRSAAEVELALRDLRAGKRPAIRALSTPARLARRVRRHPVTALGWGLLLTLAALVWWLLWWNAPVPVRIDSFLSGQVLYVDGVERGLVPVTLQLRPGDYAYELVAGRRGHDPTFTGTFEVAPLRPQWIFKLLNDRDSTPRIPELEARGLPPATTWVRLATNCERVRLELPGLDFDAEVDGIALFPVPRGTHAVRVSAEGRRPRELELQVTNGEMHVRSLELDPLDSDWHTVLAYSPFEQHVRATLETDGLRVYCEEMRYSKEVPVQVHKVYLGPEHTGRPGTAEHWLDLPVAVGDIDVAVDLHSAIGRGSLGSVELELGPAPDRTVLVCDFKALQPEGEVLAALRDLMRGSERIFVRYTVRDSPSGDLYALGCALRSNALPVRLQDGELLWSPALTIRVRAAAGDADGE